MKRSTGESAFEIPAINPAIVIRGFALCLVLLATAGCLTLRSAPSRVRGWYSDENGIIRIVDGYADYNPEPLERGEYTICVYGFDIQLNDEERRWADSHAGYKIANKHFYGSSLPIINYNTDKKKNYYIRIKAGPWKNGTLPNGSTRIEIDTHCFDGLYRTGRQTDVPPEHCYLTFTRTNRTLRVDGRIAFDLPDTKANLRFNATVSNPPVYGNRVYLAPWEDKGSEHAP